MFNILQIHNRSIAMKMQNATDFLAISIRFEKYHQTNITENAYSNESEVNIMLPDERFPGYDFSHDPVKSSMDTAIKWLSICIMIEVMLGLGCSVHLGVLKEHIKKPVGVAIAVSVQFVIMPLLVFLVARGASMPSVPAIALVVTTSVPGGSLSNVLSYLIKGDMALSMLMTACSSVLAFGFIPFNLAVYGSHWLPKDTDYSNVIPYSTVFASLTLMAVSGCIGVALNQKCNKVAVHVIRMCKVLLILTVAGLAVISALLYEDRLLLSMPWGMWFFCTFMPLVGFASGYLLSTLTKLDDSRRRTVAMETGCQNGQLGCAVLKVAFPNQLIGSFFLFPLLYSAFQLTEGLLLIALTQLRQRREESRPTVKCTLDAKTRIKTISLHVWNRLKKTGYPPHTEKLTEAPSTSFTTSPGKEPESSSTSITSDESSSQQAGAVVNHSFEKEADV